MRLEVLTEKGKADVRDIAAMKAYTIGRRGSFKDYVDLYYIIKEGADELKNIILNAEKKYANAFNTRLFLEQLVYFKDIKDIQLQFLKKKISPTEAEEFFQKEVKKINL